MSLITVFTRPKCHLCEQVLSLLLEKRINFTEIDISQDRFLEKEFGMLVPVVQIDGRVIHEAGMDPYDLPASLEHPQSR